MLQCELHKPFQYSASSPGPIAAACSAPLLYQCVEDSASLQRLAPNSNLSAASDSANLSYGVCIKLMTL